MKFSEKVWAIIDRERPADKLDLQGIMKSKHIGSYLSIEVRYYPFTTWLYRFDDQMTRPLMVNINSYRFQRQKHEDDVVAQLVNIRHRKSGSALLDEIEDSGKTLTILPYWRFGQTKLKNNADINEFFDDGGQNALAQPAGAKDDKGRSNSTIMFTPSMWGPTTFDPKTMLSTGTAGQTGAASSPDEILYHEMVHSSRIMKGLFHKTVVDKGYSDVEEYIAVVLANIFVAEKRQHRLRANHHSAESLADPEGFLDNNQRVSMSPRQLLRQFSREQPGFFRDLARIPPKDAWWNPVREFAREMGNQRPPAQGGAAAPKGAGQRRH
jgi:Effector protein